MRKPASNYLNNSSARFLQLRQQLLNLSWRIEVSLNSDPSAADANSVSDISFHVATFDGCLQDGREGMHAVVNWRRGGMLTTPRGREESD